MSEGEAKRRADGGVGPRYRLILPPGWAQIPLDDRADQAIASIVDRATTQNAAQNSPQVSAQVRAFVVSKLRMAVEDARRASGVDLYLPMELVHGAPVPLSIVVTAPRPPSSSDSVSSALLAFAARGASTAVEVGGCLAVRQSIDADAVKDESGELSLPASRRISYVIAPPQGDRMLAVTGSMMRGDGPDAAVMLAALERLFDAMAQSIKFHTEKAATP